MRGAIRVLLFWLGRDDVGGGMISLDVHKALAEEDRWQEEIEVLFGSNPERVPKRVNRWGYGREESVWKRDPATSQVELEQSSFVGYMRHSKEDSIGAVELNERTAKEKRQFWYDAIQTQVFPNKTVSKVYFFSESLDFDYRDLERVSQSYFSRLNEGSPDRVRKFENSTGSYSSPKGFLTSVYCLLKTVVGELDERRVVWREFRLTNRYIHNGRLYNLAISSVKRDKSFRFKDIQNRDLEQTCSVNDVVCVDFRVERFDKRSRHDFRIWITNCGPLRGVPLRITYKPRWWLRLELNLVSEHPNQSTSLQRQIR
jgi:hypothetical protein